MTGTTQRLLEVEGLTIRLPTGTGEVTAVRDASFSLASGDTLGLVGESGSGKSLTALALLGLLPEGAQVEGSIRLLGRELVGLPERELADLRGDRIAMVFQEPMTALNPVHPVGRQVAEPLRLHRGLSAAQAEREAIALLERVGIPDAARRAQAYPHQFSGGQRQRIMIAMALACGPDLLVADEPTTALDVTVQRQILDLVAELVAERGMGLLLISHDLGVIARRVARTLVMHDGCIVESGATAEVFERPRHAYTRSLLAARPGHAADAPGAKPPPAAPLLQVQDLALDYLLPRESLRRPAARIRALQGVSFTLQAGRNLGIVGESGSGKSTLARLVMALDTPSGGRVLFDGQDLHALAPEALRRARRDFQMVFQDPQGSLDPRWRVGRIVAEPLAAQGASPAECRERAAEALADVGLRAADMDRFPHEFSGGQRQRIAIARALITRPRLIVADEPVSALDVSVQAQVLKLMQDLQQRHGITYLFISHDLAVVRQLCDEVAVLQAGRIVEREATGQLFRDPQHPYTRALLDAVPG